MTHLEMLQLIDDDGERLTPWEIGFVADMIDSGRDIFTRKQRETIERIYRERVQ